jgi:hypothetical protein
MGMLEGHAHHVIGVDTHRDAHSAAAVATGTGTVTAQATVAADAFGYKRLLRFARGHARGRRVWAIESSGSFGAGLTTFLLAQGEWVVEVDRPSAPPGATAPSPTSSTRSAPPAKRSSATISPSPASAAIAKPSGCC